MLPRLDAADRGAARAGAPPRGRCRCSRARTARPPRPPRSGKEMANFAHRLTRARERIARVPLLGKIERRGGQLQRARRRLPGLRLGALLPALRRGASAWSSTPTRRRSSRTTGFAELFDAYARANTRAARPRPRPVGLHLARLLPPEGEGGRGRLLDHAAQGEPDRLRELRRQRRHRQRAAAPSRREAAGVALAARSLGLDRAAQRRRRARPHAARLRRLPARPLQAARPIPARSRRTWTPTGKCSPRRCSR